MNVTGLTWTSFRLPLRTPFKTAGGEMTHREGLVLRLRTDAGVVGLGEASPHPAAGPEATLELDRALASAAAGLLGGDVGCLEQPAAAMPPALACALDTAACDALARGRGISVARLLGDRSRAAVAANATIATERAVEAASEAAAAREAGFACVKLKVGMAASVEEERQRVAAVRRSLGPAVRLRIDANGAWDTERAITTIRSLEEFALELVEQPVAAGDLDGMARVQQAVQTPIAADEAITGVAAARRVLECGAASVLVVKPMVVGGLRPARRIVELAEEAGVGTIVTTTIDAAVGVAAALHLAATLPEGSPACGLATGSLLTDDLIVRPLEVRDGSIVLPDGPGLGVELNEAKLARYGGVTREAP